MCTSKTQRSRFTRKNAASHIKWSAAFTNIHGHVMFCVYGACYGDWTVSRGACLSLTRVVVMMWQLGLVVNLWLHWCLSNSSLRYELLMFAVWQKWKTVKARQFLFLNVTHQERLRTSVLHTRAHRLHFICLGTWKKWDTLEFQTF